MVGCVLSQLKPSALYILSCEKCLGLRPLPFSQLRMLLLGLYPILIGCHTLTFISRHINPYSAGTDFSRQNLTSLDVRL